MPRPRAVHRCVDCGATSPRWAGRCPACGEWDTLIEERVEAPGAAGAGAVVGAVDPIAISEVDIAGARASSTGIGELDRVLGGGLVPGSVTLLAGEPGVGKSTLVLQAMSALTGAGARCLLISAEESLQQVRGRAERLDAVSEGLWLAAETGLAEIAAAVDRVDPDVLVVDSIQTVHDPAIESGPGSVAQVRGCAQALVQLAKGRAMATLLVGHVTKEGAVAGPRVLEHLVDTVLSFEGERHHALRLLRAVKHRFGPTGELGLFEMAEEGLVGVPDPGGLFLGDRRQGAPGSVVFPAIEGHRPLLVELQALVAPSALAMPRRSAQGLDGGRLALLVAVLDRRAGIVLHNSDVYASAVGGVRIAEPGADLALALALASAQCNVPVAPDLVVCGEVGLAGELRQVSQTGRRLAEAARLGFGRAVVPCSAPEGPPGQQVCRVGTLAEALLAVGLRSNERITEGCPI
jgi:DNA repair protein RadA/Sms